MRKEELQDLFDIKWYFRLYLQPLHYGNIFKYLSLWGEVEFLKIQQSKKIQKKSKKSKNLTNLGFTPETCQKIEKMLILNSSYTGE